MARSQQSQQEEFRQVPHPIRPGDVLTDRYTLVDLLSESGNGRFWRAHDRVLERHVALHVIATDDERAAGMIAAARRSATVHDRRILRVLDADEGEEISYVVHEWGSGVSLDIMVGGDGVLSPRRAAWIVSEAAAAFAVAHDAEVAHGRLVPENVLVDRTGAVRVIGFAVDAALLGLPDGRRSADVVDLAGLLYFLLTGKWAGVSRSACPTAPQQHGRVLRPRQVRAGIPRTLDSLCDEVINAGGSGTPPGDAAGPGTARELSEALAAFVGDATGMAAAEVARHHADQRTVTLPTPSAGPVREAQEPRAAPEPPAPAPSAPAGPLDQPTQAGLPIFDDEADDVSWMSTSPEAPPPPPPFEEQPERPLFAPEPPDGSPPRRPREGAAGDTDSSREYWPWAGDPGSGTLPATPADERDDDEGDDDVPGRSWLRLAVAVAASLLLLVAIVLAFNLGRGRSPLGNEESADGDEPSASPSDTPSASATPLTDVTAADFDPQGDPPEENRALAPLVVDGDSATAWRTVTYEQNLGPGGLKTGVGIALDLGTEQDVSGVDLTFLGEPPSASIYVAERSPSGVRGLTPVATADARVRQRVDFEEAVTGRFVIVWLTSLPEADGGYRGEIAEVVVRG